MGLWKSSGKFTSFFFPSSQFLCSTRKPVSSPRHTHSGGRRAQGLSRTALLQRRRRLVLYWPEHDGTLDAVGMTIRGEPAVGRDRFAPQPCIRWAVTTRTMMQSCASAAKLRGGGPILHNGVKAVVSPGTPPPRTVIGDPSRACGQARNCQVLRSTCSVHCAGRRMMPSGTTPSRTKCQSAISSLRARATIIFLREPRAFSVRA